MLKKVAVALSGAFAAVLQYTDFSFPWILPFLIPLFKARFGDRFLWGFFYFLAVSLPVLKGFFLTVPSEGSALTLFLLTVLFLTLYQFGPTRLLTRLGVPFCLSYTLVEILRTHYPFGGYPLGIIGFSVVGFAPFENSLRWVGPFGATLLVLISARLLGEFLAKRGPLFGTLFFSFFLLWFSVSDFLRPTEGKTELKGTLTVVQPFWNQKDKLEREELLTPYKVYLLYEASLSGGKVIFLPEGFFDPSEAPLEILRLFEGNFVAGANRLIFDFEGGGYYALNAVLYVENGALKGVYLKRKLVPFGEFTPQPFRFLERFVPYLGNVDYRAGNAVVLFKVGKLKVQPLICNEAFYPELVDRRADLVVVLANDAWFFEPFSKLHLKAARMMALSKGKFVLFVNSVGNSALLFPDGRVLKAYPQRGTFSKIEIP